MRREKNRAEVDTRVLLSLMSHRGGAFMPIVLPYVLTKLEQTTIIFQEKQNTRV